MPHKQPLLADAIGGAAISDDRWHRKTAFVTERGKTLAADSINHFKWPALPVEAELHRVINILRVCGDIGNQTGGIAQHPAQNMAAELRLWVAAVDNRQQWFSPTRCCVGGGHRRGWQIFAGDAIGRQPIALMPGQLACHAHPVGAGHVKAALAFIAGKAIGNHSGDHPGNHFVVTTHRVKFITIWQNGAKRCHNISHQINADQIIQTEHASFGNAHWPPHQRVSIFDRQATANGLVNADLQRKYTDPVTQKSGGVGTAHNTLSKNAVVKVGQPVNDMIGGIGAAHQFEQAHIAHRVEIMGDGKSLSECCWHVFNKQFDRNG